MGYEKMPKGFSSLNSPYGRKVRIAEIETLQRGLIEWKFLSREERILEMPSINPLGKVPALILENGSLLIDSPVIASWVDQQHNGRRLIPEQQSERYAVLNLEAIGDGLSDAAIAVSLEESRPENEKSDTWIMRNKQKLYQTLVFLNNLVDNFDDSKNILNLGEISIACAIGYMDFREVVIDWRSRYPQLAGWYEATEERGSFKETAIEIEV